MKIVIDGHLLTVINRYNAAPPNANISIKYTSLFTNHGRKYNNEQN